LLLQFAIESICQGDYARLFDGDIMTAEREMPHYKCHKEVWALKIKTITCDGDGEDRESDGSAIITPAEEGYAPFKVTHEYMRKHNYGIGGYYVVYHDGYKSFSPPLAFEDGYKLIADNNAPTADVSAFGPVNCFDKPHPEGSYVRLCVNRDFVRISRGAAEVLAAELLGRSGNYEQGEAT
jgi:hypothetical protein